MSGIINWTPGQPTAIIDLGEQVAPDPSASSASSIQFPSAYYAIDSSAEYNGSKKRKVERACDFCRKRKARCDGPRMPDNVCTNCIQNARSCTYLEGSKPRGPPKAYVTGLEDRVEKMEALLRRLRPETDFSEELGPPVIRDSWRTQSSPPIHGLETKQEPSGFDLSPTDTKPRIHSIMGGPPLRARILDPSQRPPKATAAAKGTSRRAKSARGLSSGSNSERESSSSSLSDSSDTDELGELSLVRGMKHLTIRGLEPKEGSPDPELTDNQWRFHGKSSSFKLITATREFMLKHLDEASQSSGDSARENLSVSSQPLSSVRRPEFWSLPPWEKEYEHVERHAELPDFVIDAFPPEELAQSLIDAYFYYYNNVFPLLHHTTFMRQWTAGLHHREYWFACVCMAVFGVASRWSSDPRVLPENVREMAKADPDCWSLAGWGFVSVAMRQHELRRSVLCPPDLFEIQALAIVAQYLRSTVAQTVSWFYLSVGVRKAQDVGAHRKKIYGRKPTLEEELWKRAYWHLVAFDRIGSMLNGRLPCSREEDLDIGYPVEVDDEYWENDDPELAFRQPEGQPSLGTAFIWWIKLSQIAAFALNSLYSCGNTKGDLKEVVGRINEALSKWIDEIPPHLRWTPDMENQTFASQAASLITTYHLVQITAYRPFIFVPRHGSEDPMERAAEVAFAQTALSICVSSARAAGYVLETQTKRGMSNMTNVIHVSLFCAGVHLVDLWRTVRQEARRGGGRLADPESEPSQKIAQTMKDIKGIMKLLEDASQRWELAREMLADITDALPDSYTSDMSPSAVAPSIPMENNFSPPNNGHVPPAEVYSPLIHRPPWPTYDHYDDHGQMFPHSAGPSSAPPRRHYQDGDRAAPFADPFGGTSAAVPQLWTMHGGPSTPPRGPADLGHLPQDFEAYAPPPEAYDNGEYHHHRHAQPSAPAHRPYVAGPCVSPQGFAPSSAEMCMNPPPHLKRGAPLGQVPRTHPQPGPPRGQRRPSAATFQTSYLRQEHGMISLDDEMAVADPAEMQLLLANAYHHKPPGFGGGVRHAPEHARGQGQGYAGPDPAAAHNAAWANRWARQGPGY